MPSGSMRVIVRGPDIPEELLVARDEGDVIFFCGAGVFQANARLPNFERLGRHVIRILGATLDGPRRRLLDKALEMGRMAGVEATSRHAWPGTTRALCQSWNERPA